MTRDTIEPRLDTYHFYEDDWAGYDDLRESFEWEIPDRFNMATYVLDRWATTDPDRVAIYGNDQDRVLTEYTYRDLERAASQLANYLESQGIGRGDRVAVNGSQKAELLIGHLAAWKLGAISVPLSILFGPEGLGFRLDDSGAKAYVVDSGSLGALREIRGDLDALETVVTVDADPGVDEVSFEDAITDQPDSFETVDTNAEDVAMLIYTSGTTGPPKGVAHAHRGILGILPGFAMSICNMEITDDDVARGPVEWSWAGSLNDLILPCLYYGIPIVAHARGEFDPVAEFELLDDFDVTVTGGPATDRKSVV